MESTTPHLRSQPVDGVLDDWSRRYLRLVELEPEPPSLAALRRITRAHVLRIPFENVTSLLRFRDARGLSLPAVDPGALLDRWERRAGGGVCYEHVGTLERLLGALGYSVRAVAGQISFPGSHQAVLVELDEGSYLVDAGNGAPFFEPIPLGQTMEMEHAGLRYRFRPGEGDIHVQERWIEGAWTPFCNYLLAEQSPAMREAAFRRHHQPRESFVISILTVVRCTQDAVYALRGTELTCFTSTGKSTEQLSTSDDYERVAAGHLDLPAMPILEARAVLAALDG